MKPKAIDVFAGCGGLTTGLKKAGFVVIGGVEIDKAASDVYRLNHPKVQLWEEDILGLSAKRIKTKLGLRSGELDLLAGCPPCQGFSRVTTLNGGYTISDERNDLVFEFMRLVKDLKPKAIMLENVPGLADDGRFKKFTKQLSALGYKFDFKILDVADYAVPQRRKRLILLAGRSRSIGFGNPARGRKTVLDAIGNLPSAGSSGDPIHDLPENRSRKIQRLIAMVPKNGGSRTDLPKKHRLECHKRCDGFKDVYGRMRWDDVAPTLTTGCFNPSKGRFLHPDENRAITMREAALLQTFPPRYKFPAKLGKVAIAMQIGNALPPEFVRRHALAVRRHLEMVADESE